MYNINMYIISIFQIVEVFLYSFQIFKIKYSKRKIIIKYDLFIDFIFRHFQKEMLRFNIDMVRAFKRAY
jgi:hypothetical protein